MSGHGSASSLSPAAEAVWNAYQAMSESKRAHFELLARLHEKRDRGEMVGLAEKTRLDQLLAEHDKNVKNFASGSRDLAGSEPEQHRQLVELIAAAADGTQ